MNNYLSPPSVRLPLVYLPRLHFRSDSQCINKKEETKLHTTEMRMLRWTRGKTRLDHVRNVDIWKEAHMYPMAEFLREKRWFGHVQRWDEDEATRKILQMTVDGKQNRGRPNLRWRDLVKEDMTRNQGWVQLRNCNWLWKIDVIVIESGSPYVAVIVYAIEYLL